MEAFLLPMQSLITITTDLGDQFAAAQLHAMLAGEGFNGRIVENHDVAPFCILEGAFQVDVLSRFSPHGSIHVGIVDPGVGSSRRGVIIQCQDSWFVGPDNGLLSHAASLRDIKKVWVIQESYFGEVSRTFHGRDVFIRAAARLAKGELPEQFGCQSTSKSTIIPLHISEGQVVHIDDFGNIKVFSKQPTSNRITVHTYSRTEDVPFVSTFSDVPKGAPLALLGSSGTLELAVNLCRADEYFGLKVGDQVKIE